MSGESSTIRFKQADGSAQTQQAGAPATKAQPKSEVAVGKGLDVGTANLLSAAQDENGEIYVVTFDAPSIYRLVPGP